MLLGLPVSRRTIYVCESVVWLVAGALILSCGLVGHRFSLAITAGASPPLGPTLLVIVNFFCMYIAVGGITYLVSALSDRRGRAIATVCGIVLTSFLLNFLAQFWEPAQNVLFLSVLNYYSPAEILQSGSLPIGDLAVLLGIGIATWVAAGEVIARRSICTV